ncbi:AAA family ATPase [Flavobacterium zhairuonense]|uniref:AAA family ATPase n=1 Tax=Flavobacterium zhairuonense TaxID=2493631 RepID=UPI00104F0DC6|nr:AAA family ATPase [Flavobacterium zhairuonense]KAF2508371.1 AAA family ATPase [Flavobacterium zhairuonense]
MELKFVWIKEYKNIINTGFNFNHSVDQEFRFENNELIISILPKSFKNFFKENVSNVTAIVGKNGSGKTNLTEFINYNLAHATNGRLSTYIKSNGLIILDDWIFVQNEIEIKNSDFLEDIGYKILKYDNAPLDDNQVELSWYEMARNKYIYYNPTFDLRGIPVTDNLINISTTMLVYSDYENSEKLFSYVVDKDSKINQLDAYSSMEKNRIYDFILNYESVSKYIEFLPEKIEFKIDTIENNYLLNKIYFDSKELEDGINEEIKNLQTELNYQETYQIDNYDYQQYFVRAKEQSVIKYYKIPITEQKAIFFRLLFVNIFQILLNKKILFPRGYFYAFLYEELQNENFEDFDIQSDILELKEKVKNVINNSKWIDFEVPIPDSDSKKSNIYRYLGSLIISFPDNKEIIKEMTVLMDKLLDNTRIFTCESLNEFSSGQKHLLTLYSRFFWTKKEIDKSETKPYGIEGESIVIFVDEGEVALHPEWQRTFFKNMIDYLSDLFVNKKIQLILTTHSPFVLSDIPKNNVLFLDKDENNNTIISNIEREETFGANIHELLSDSFFLNQGFMGEFAKSKILDLINYLTFNDKVSEDENNIKPKQKWSEDIALKVINVVGEQVIRDRLLNLFDKKFTFKSKDSIIARMEELQNELKKFEK